MTTIELLRLYRFGDYALFDLFLAFLGMYLLAPVLSKIFRFFKLEIPKINWVFFTLPIGMVLHVLTKANTVMTKNFFDTQSHYFIKILIFSSLILGLMGIRVIGKDDKNSDKIK
jgi:uncharacterized membrane protein